MALGGGNPLAGWLTMELGASGVPLALVVVGTITPPAPGSPVSPAPGAENPALSAYPDRLSPVLRSMSNRSYLFLNMEVKEES